MITKSIRKFANNIIAIILKTVKPQYLKLKHFLNGEMSF